MIGVREPAAGWAAIGAGAGFVATAASLLTRALRPTLEARAYVEDIRAATDGAVQNLHALSQLEQTRDASARLARALEATAGAQR